MIVDKSKLCGKNVDNTFILIYPFSYFFSLFCKKCIYFTKSILNLKA